MDKALNNQIIETIYDTYIAELHNKYTGLIRVKTIYQVHHRMDIYGEIIKTELKEKQTLFDEALYTTMTIDKYF